MPDTDTRSSQSIKQLKYLGSTDVGDYPYTMTCSLSSAIPRLFIGAANGIGILLDSSTQQEIRRWNAHPMGILSSAFSMSSNHAECLLATGGQDGLVKIYHAETGEEIATCQAGSRSDWVEHIGWSPTEKLLATAAGKSLKIWTTSGELEFEFTPHDNTIAGLGWHPKIANQLATTSYNGLRRYEIGSLNPIRRFIWKGSSLHLFWSPDGKHIASATQDSTVHVWNSKNGQDVQMPGYPIKPTVQAWRHDSRYLATGGSSSVVLWDFSGRGPAGKNPIVLEAHQDFVTALAYQHQGKLLATGAQDGTIYVWKEDNTPIQTFELLDEEVRHLCWSIDDSLLIAAGHSGQIYFFKQ